MSQRWASGRDYLPSLRVLSQSQRWNGISLSTCNYRDDVWDLSTRWGLKKSPLLNFRTVRKIVNLDDHIALACAGLKADARALINKVRIECQSHQLTVEDPVTVEYITRYIAGLQQKYTQSGGVRPFGLSTLIIGFDPYTGAPALYQIDPFGTFSAWKENATERNSNSLREFLEKNYKETAGQETVKLAIRALLEGNQQRRESTSEAKIGIPFKRRKLSSTTLMLAMLISKIARIDYPVEWKGYGL
ncbi:proteasome subunit alpha type-7-like [Humulus lupulus]|uniref:proteasome subunit alpha type-7-like n=1 Tax=Humulus lupulus TaxID=3486 RepID=UPI002B40F32F|nr:proteasome subunit alpha type-7-like [Humulus lupulus]